jgi:4-carboxymuconolactone decarboxylase
MNKNEIGQQRIKDILGPKSADLIKIFESISPDFAKYIIEFAYGDLYNRRNFSDKMRELAAVACLVGQGNTGVALTAHLRGMMNVGWTKEEIIELLIFLIGYTGFPSCVGAIMAFKDVLDSQKS